MRTSRKVEHVAEWLRHWTQDLGIGVRSRSAVVTCKSLGQALNPHYLCPPSMNGYQVERRHYGDRKKTFKSALVRKKGQGAKTELVERELFEGKRKVTKYRNI